MVAGVQVVLAVVVNGLMVEHVGRGVARTSSTNWFSCYGVYCICCGALTTRDRDGNVVFSKIGIWLGTLGDDPTVWDGFYLCKLGFTARTFQIRLQEVYRELRDAGFPMDEMNLELKYILIGMSRQGLKLIEDTVRNTATDRHIRFRHHANAAVGAAGTRYRTTRSEMNELVQGDNTSTLWKLFRDSATTLLESWNAAPFSKEERAESVDLFWHRMEAERLRRQEDDTRRFPEICR